MGFLRRAQQWVVARGPTAAARNVVLVASCVLAPLACESPAAPKHDAGTGVPGCPTLTEPSEGTAHPPPPPTAAAGSGPGVVFAIHKLLLGDRDTHGTASTDAWKTFGYDLDGTASSKCTSDHCQPRQGGNRAAIAMDGPGGVDNSFGYNVLPVYLGLAADVGADVQASLQRGDHTLLLAIDNVGAGTAAVGLHGVIYEGGPLGHTPLWDGTDTWTVFCEYLETCLSTGTPPPPGNPSSTAFHEGYVSEGVLVVRPEAPVVIGLNWLGAWFPLRLHQAVISMRLEPGSETPRRATQGVIAGVLDTQEYLAGTEEHLSDFCLSFEEGWCQKYVCNGPTKDSVLTQIAAASDIMIDGSQNAETICDGISVGLGFEAVEVQLGAAADRQPPAVDPCAD